MFLFFPVFKPRRSEARRWNSWVDQSTVPYVSRPMRAHPGYGQVPKAYPHERGLLKETCACLVLLPLQLMSTHSQLIRTVCIDYCIPLVAPRIGFTVKARPNEPPCRKKPELDVPIRPPEPMDSRCFLVLRPKAWSSTKQGAREPIRPIYPRFIREITRAFRVG